MTIRILEAEKMPHTHTHTHLRQPYSPHNYRPLKQPKLLMEVLCIFRSTVPVTAATDLWLQANEAQQVEFCYQRPSIQKRIDGRIRA